MTRAQLDKKPVDVASMFDTVAEKYDVTNDVMTAGIDRLWRRAVVKAVGARRGERILDIAAGTGTSSEPWADREIEVVPADFSLGMLRVGRRRRPDMAFTAADAMSLPFADASFDVVTMSYGLRNVSDTDAALREFLRVAKPGGRLVVCEFSQPVNRVVRGAYGNVVLRLLPAIARRTASNAESYVYLAESIRDWPPQGELARRIEQAGWSSVGWQNLTGGIVALHTAVKR